MLHQWSEGEVFILSRFDGYHLPSSLEYAVFSIHQRLPTVRQVEEVPTVIGSEGGYLLRYMADEIDAVFFGSPNVDDELSDQLAVFPQLNTFYLGLNSQEPPFDDLFVRRAFVMALDRKGLIETVYGGGLDLAKGLLPPGMPAYSEGLMGLPYDPIAALLELVKSRHHATSARLPSPFLGMRGPGAGQCAVHGGLLARESNR